MKPGPGIASVMKRDLVRDSTADSPESVSLTDWQREELDRRLAEFESDPDSGSPFKDVLARIQIEPQGSV